MPFGFGTVAGAAAAGREAVPAPRTGGVQRVTDPQYTGYRSGTMMGGRMSVLSIDKSFFEAIENHIRWCEVVRSRQLPKAMNTLVMTMALIHLGIAQEKSMGPYDPQERGFEVTRFKGGPAPEGKFGGRYYQGSMRKAGFEKRSLTAWKVPVRRITGRYFMAWKVKRMRMGQYKVYNDSREAFYIELGLHPTSPNKTPRPINRIALQGTLKFMAGTSAAHRFWAEAYVPPPSLRAGHGFKWTYNSYKGTEFAI